MKTACKRNTGLIILLFGFCVPTMAEPVAARQLELLNLLQQDCGSCHGLTLKGGLGPALTPQAVANKPKQMLVETILRGRPGTPMPPWSPFMNREEVVWLVDVLYKGINHAH